MVSSVSSSRFSLMMFGSGTIVSANLHTDSSKVAEKRSIWHSLGRRLRGGGSETDWKCEATWSERLSALLGSYRWMRMLWSRCPCMAIITSASSKMNMVIFLGSMKWYFVHQSSIVPGVPITICSCSGTPLCTVGEIHAASPSIFHQSFGQFFI